MYWESLARWTLPGSFGTVMMNSIMPGDVVYVEKGECLHNTSDFYLNPQKQKLLLTCWDCDKSLHLPFKTAIQKLWIPVNA